jgi:hypothetical protein
MTVADIAGREEGEVVITTLEAAPTVAYATHIEQQAAQWIEPFSQALHLVRARDWLVYLLPEATLEARLATLTHDIERMFPGGPKMNKATDRWDDPHYLYAHGARSAEVVGVWLHGQRPLSEPLSVPQVRHLITLHEFGGLDEADFVQAADSLSFLETLQDVVLEWVKNGECGVPQARAKHTYMAERIRIPRAAELAQPLLAQALATLDDIAE